MTDSGHRTPAMSDREDELAEHFRRQVEASVRVKQALSEDLGACIAVARELIRAYRAGRTMFVFGNGGSAADAQHIAAEFLGRFYIERRGLAAHALTVNTSALTAIANDYSFERIFSRQLRALGAAGDIAVGISTSGNAANVVDGLAAGREMGIITVALTGASGGRAKDFADHWVSVPSDDTPRIQEAQIMIGHIWSELVEAALFGPEAG